MLTEPERRATALAARKEQCRRSLAEFTRQAWHVLEPATHLKWGWALDAICEHLEAITKGHLDREGRGARLVINVPPGSMKSLLVGVFWPAWEWGPCGFPSMRYLGTAHKQDLAVRDNLKCRRLIQSRWYQNRWAITLTGDQNAKTKFENSATGFREAMAFTSLTGSRGRRLAIDDPHSVDDANSPTVLGTDVRTFREAVPSRIEDEHSAILLIMQRLNERDVSAVALELGYDHLCIPMRFEVDRRCVTSIGWADPRKEAGELMFPERFSEAQVAELEMSLGSYAAAGQLQQRPAPREGGMFKRRWFEIVDAAPAGLRCVRAWDLAGTVASVGNDPDWTVGVKIGRAADAFLYILDVVRFRGSPADVERTIRNTAEQDGKDCSVRVPQDPGQAGKAQASALTRLLSGFIVSAVAPTGSKETRAMPFAAQCEAGNVRIVKAGWNEAFFDEIEVFPFGKHDDQVDAAADSFAVLHDTSGSAGFLALIHEDKAKRAADAEESTKTAAITNTSCPFPKGSLEYLKFHGLVS
jgi:predicted phage terminase large subunit-like protein